MWLIIFFIFTIFSPSIQNITHFIHLPSLDESRGKAPLPTSFSPYQIDTYLNDNFGLRDLLVRLKNQIDYSLFRYSKQAVIGRHGWLEDINVLVDQQPTLDHYTDQQFDQTISKILIFNQKIKNKGATLILLPIPLKSTVYPQEFPAVSRSNPTGFLRFLTRLQSKSELQLINLLEIFSSSNNLPLFYRTDLHWNEAGARLASQAIVNRLASLSHLSPPQNQDITYRQENFVGAISQSMGLIWPITEIAIFQNKPSKNCGQQPFPARSGVTAPFPFAMTYHSPASCHQNILPDTILIGNSFMLYFYDNGFTDYFKNLYTIHDLTNFQDTLANIPIGIRYVIWQFFETEIAYQFQQDLWWQQLNF